MQDRQVSKERRSNQSDYHQEKWSGRNEQPKAKDPTGAEEAWGRTKIDPDPRRKRFGVVVSTSSLRFREKGSRPPRSGARWQNGGCKQRRRRHPVSESSSRGTKKRGDRVESGNDGGWRRDGKPKQNNEEPMTDRAKLKNGSRNERRESRDGGRETGERSA